MLRKFMVGLAVVASVTVIAKPASAQFGAGYLDFGPVVGFGGLGTGAGVDIGGRLEKGIKTLPSLGGGMLGIQIGGDYYSYGPSGYSVKVIVIQGTANYHFKVSNDKFDPFVGLGLGFAHASCPDLFGFSCSASSVDFVGKAGARYFFSPKMALYGDLGTSGAATINLGVMFKLK